MNRIVFMGICTLIASIFPNLLKAQTGEPINQSIVMEYLQSQQYDLAVEYLEPRIAQDNPKQLNTLAYAYYMSSQFDEAESLYKKVLGLDSNNLLANYYMGGLYMQKDLPMVSISFYSKLIALQPQNANYFRLLSNACTQNNQFDSAFNYLQESVRLNPKDPKTTGTLGNLYVERKQYISADSMLNAYLARDSSQFAVTAAAVKSAYMQKQYARVAEFGDYLMRTRVMSPTTFTYVVAANYYDKQYERCVKIYNYLLTMNQATEVITYYTALAQSKLKAYDKSNELLQTCISLAKSKSLDDYYTSMADNFESMKQYKTAIAHLDTAYYYWQDPLRQYGMAKIYDQYMSNTPQAQKHYRLYFVRAKPDDAQDTAIHKFVKERMKQLSN